MKKVPSKHVGSGIFGALNGGPGIGQGNDEELLESNGKVVVIIEPCCTNSPEVTSGLLFNSDKRKRAILDSVIGEYLRCINSIRVSRDGKRLILVLLNRGTEFRIPEETVRAIYALKMLGDCHVECRKPKGRPSVSTGVLQGFHPLSSVDCVINDLKLQKYEFRKVYRLMKNVGGEKVPTASILIEFLNIDQLPRRVCVDFCEYKIRKFDPEPIRCYKCQRFNHFERHCNSSVPVCGKCSGNHPTDKCNRDGQSGPSSDTLLKCSNCKGEHPASSKDCPNYRKVKKILKIQSDTGMSYAMAAKAEQSGKGQEKVSPIPRTTFRGPINVAPEQGRRLGATILP